MVGIGWEITHDQTASRIRPKVSEVAKYGAYLPSGKLAVAVLVLQRGDFRATKSKSYVRDFSVPRVCLDRRLNFLAISA
jgi:hypothetical protein